MERSDLLLLVSILGGPLQQIGSLDFRGLYYQVDVVLGFLGATPLEGILTDLWHPRMRCIPRVAEEEIEPL